MAKGLLLAVPPGAVYGDLALLTQLETMLRPEHAAAARIAVLEVLGHQCAAPLGQNQRRLEARLDLQREDNQRRIEQGLEPVTEDLYNEAERARSEVRQGVEGRR